jgi:hypothetical protein
MLSERVDELLRTILLTGVCWASSIRQLSYTVKWNPSNWERGSSDRALVHTVLSSIPSTAKKEREEKENGTFQLHRGGTEITLILPVTSVTQRGDLSKFKMCLDLNLGSDGWW